MSGGRDRRDARGEGVEDGGADLDLWPGKRTATQRASGDPGNIEGHRVITGFVVHDGFIMKPRPGDTSPRLEFVIKKATKVGNVDKAVV